MMEPYYHDTHCTLYLGDCRELLPALALPRVDLLLSDPPYGVGWDTDYRKDFQGGQRKGLPRHQWQPIHDDAAPFDPSPWLAYPQVILWGANCYSSRLPLGRWLVWDKRFKSGKSFFAADAEAAWMKGGHGIRLYSQTWQGIARSKTHASERINGRTPSFSPCQKPVALACWCIAQARRVQTVLDPFAGSGWVLIAAKTLGLRAWGCEIEEAYAETAARRLAATAAGEAAA
jgi:site-specific DNA-methyltransferase (adenine-specific)